MRSAIIASAAKGISKRLQARCDVRRAHWVYDRMASRGIRLGALYRSSKGGVL